MCKCRLSTKNFCLWACCLALALATLGSSEIETFKMPSDQLEVEVVRGRSTKVFFGLRNVTEEDIESYQIRLGYKGQKLQPGTSISNLDDLLTLDLGNCISINEGTKCKELEVTLSGNDDLNNEVIELIVIKFKPHPVLNIMFPADVSATHSSQKFTIKIVDPPTSPPPTTSLPTTEPVTCPSRPPVNPQANTSIGLSRGGGNALLGVLLSTAFLVSFVGNFVILIMWYKERSKNGKLTAQRREAVNLH